MNDYANEELLLENYNLFVSQGMSKDDAFSKAYLIDCDLDNEDTYICNTCGIRIGWQDIDSINGAIWECEDCGLYFCTKCFEDRFGRPKFDDMMQHDDIIRCPDCFKAIEETIGLLR